MNKTIKIFFVLIFYLQFIGCENKVGFEDIEIKQENGLTIGYLKSDNSLFSGDLIETYGVQKGVDFNSATGESFPAYEEYPTFEAHFKNGLASGIWRWYDDEGLIEEEISYKNGKYHGVSQEWDEHGVLLVSEIWEAGKLVCEHRHSPRKKSK